MADPPQGFEPYAELSPFLDRVGPLYQRAANEGPVFGLRILQHHCNRRGFAHGGMLVTLADIALGKTGEWSQDPPVSLLTVGLTVEFLGAARLGDWVEAASDFYRVGREMAFANCYLTVGDRKIGRASGVFKALSRMSNDGDDT